MSENKSPSPFVAGLDLGQASDYTALAILERDFDGPRPGYDCRVLQRSERGAPYPAIVRAVNDLLASPELNPVRPRRYSLRGEVDHAQPPWLVVDATGVGRAVVDLFLAGRKGPTTPLTITAGEAARWDKWTGTFRQAAWTPKRELVGTVQALLQTGRLRFVPGLALAEVMKKELLEFKVRITTAANETFGAGGWREGGHDDLVLAVAMAAWVAENRPRTPSLSFGRNVLAGWHGRTWGPAGGPPGRRGRR